MERLSAALDKMHQILTHLSEVLPGAGGIGGMLTAMKMDIEAVAAEIAAKAAPAQDDGHGNDAADPASESAAPTKAKKAK